MIRIFFRVLQGSIGFDSTRNPKLSSDGYDLTVLMNEYPLITYPLGSIREIRWEEK